MLYSITKTLRRLGYAAAAVAAIAVSAAPLTAQSSPSLVPSRIVQPLDEKSLVTLHGYVHPLASHANDRGAAPDSMPLTRMHLVLKRSASQESTLQQMIADMHAPGSANYHKWLTPAQFGQQFGPSDQDVATVTSWLSTHGFEVTGVKSGKQVIEFNGNVAQLRSAFHAQIHKYVADGNIHYATANDPQIPAALAPVVGGFVALNDFRVKKQVRILGQASYDTKTHAVKPNWTYGTSAGVNFVVAPADFGVQYDLPDSLLNHTYPAGGTQYDGAGQTVAIVNDANINIDLVNQFRTLFGLPANPPTVVVDGNDPGLEGINNPDGPNFDSDEAYIDVEWSGAVAPKANIDMVIAADTALEGGLYLATEDAVYSDIAPVVSVSFGACEAAIGSTNAFLDALIEQAAAQGQTVVVSAGDNGSAACDSDNQPYAVNGVAVSGFASTPWDVAIGGTDFYYTDYATGAASSSNYWITTPTQAPAESLKTRIPEQPWNDSQYGLDAANYYDIYGTTTIAGGSGGASSAAVCSAGYDSNGNCTGTPTGYPKPSWQTGNGVPADGVRDLPDLSLYASDGSNYSFYPFCYADGDCQSATGSNLVQISGAGGTSFGAPAFAGIMALINEKYGSQGQADFVLYPLKAQFPAAFHDVTVGTNAMPCNIGISASGDSPLDCISVANPLTAPDGTVEGELGTGTTPDYDATAGYNLATGLGTLDVSQLIADWGSVTFKSTSMTLTPSSTSFAHGTAVTISGSVTGSGTVTGNVALMTGSSETANQGSGFGEVLAGGQSTFAVANGAYSGSVNDLPGGTYNIWGTYSGDGTNAASKSQPTQITVTPEASSIYFNILDSTTTTSGNLAISGGDTTVSYGTQGILDAEVAPTTYYNSCLNSNNPPANCSTTAYTPPTGTVSFSDNGSTINAAQINAEGDAEFNAPFSIGAHSVSASYSGDSSYNTSTSSSIAFTVVQNTPNIYVGAANQNPNITTSFTVVGGQPTVFYVLVENSANSTSESTYNIGLAVPVSAPSGTITVTGPSAVIPNGSATLTLAPEVDPTDYLPDGVAQVTIPASAAAGTYTITISYSGDKNYTALTGSNAASGSITIQSPTQLTTTMTASMSGTLSPNSPITVTGTVTGQSGKPAPTGVVYVYPDGDTLAQFSLTPGSGDSSTFSGTLTSQVLAQGANIVTLYYSGDTTYNSNTYLLNSGTAISSPLSDFTITAASGLVSVPASGTATTTLYLTPVNGFSGSVALGCALPNAPAGVTCTVSPTSASLSYSNTASLPQEKSRWNLLATGGGAALACVLMLTVPARRRAWRNLLTLVLFACIAGFGIGCGSNGGGGTGGCTVGCGGGGGTGNGAVANPSQSITLTVTTSGATAGSYGVTVTGTSSTTNQIHTLGVIAQVQ